MPMINNKNGAVTPIIVVILLALTLFPLSSDARRRTLQRPQNAPAAATVHPKLVVIIMIDQCRYDFIERFWDLFGDKGFRRLVKEGAFFTNANYDYVPTVTAAGHAAVHTGSVPAQNGIFGNYLVEFDPKTGLPLKINGELPTIVYDAATHPVTSAGVGSKNSASPGRLIGTTLGNELKTANPQSKVVAMAGKDRSAVLPGGAMLPKGTGPDGVYWYGRTGDSGEFITSTYYFQDKDSKDVKLPKWVKDFNTNDNTKASKYLVNWKWDRSRDAKVYDRAMSRHIPVQCQVLCMPADASASCDRSYDCDFPYDVNKANFEYTPFASDYLESFAEAAFSTEGGAPGLGQDSVTDLLAISFSQPDLLGHAYGPDSQEIEDTYIRLDTTLGRFLDFIDQKVGGLKNNSIIALTADHGVVPIPQYLHARGFDAGVVDIKKIRDAVNKELQNKFGFGGDDWVGGIANEQLYLNPKLIKDVKSSGKDPAEVERVAADVVLKADGIAGIFTRTEIEAMKDLTTPGALAQGLKNGYYKEGSGDVWLITKPFWFLSEGIATTHGSPYDYDTHVPLILYGAGVKPGRYSDACSPSDIAPTLAKLLGIKKPSKSVGRELAEALKQVQGR